ncbi:MAG: hypothetical protein KDB27_02845 [Planctomycetales bacterium]|nr:hypothetical protein [Planctomycetales bacterium]
MKTVRSYFVLGLGVLVSLLGLYATITTDANLGGGGALVIGAMVIGFWLAGWVT